METSEGDMMSHPRPDLRCVEHEALCECVHSLLGRLVILEARVKMLEDKERGDA